ncbi:MFS transporter [Brevirhabdus pacifica]|uniref:MFS transporter n=1 Tax=Brevirhabdus pacifica TaxID=1267768 RepID=A0A1U7DJ73_9RHOB|nr:MFS transporter [Brevirhabdus pacifica]APX89949.1 MFS transporter [Brevirhabdus pacifica]OWU74326.1 MFS transporter [Loktanella sp. 22II-4b]PJJ82821.1 UMF1 family MFS transporter [Brevirhabdus pacifica]
MDRTARRRIFGWMMFDWASQPYNTLLLTFIFAPYFASGVLGDPVRAQSLWGLTIGMAGLVIALLAPVLGALADSSGRRMPWIWLFSALYFVGAFGLWWAVPGMVHVWPVLVLFALGLIGMEFATIFTNALLPGLGPRREIGRISGSGWALGYVGGVLSLLLMLLLLAENEAGVTLLGRPPLFGLDPALREGTRSVGPLVAIWYALFMIPFFLWVREARPAPAARQPLGEVVGAALSGLARTLRTLPRRPSLMAYLASSMSYRDALNGMYTFGGIYAAGVLGWSVIDIGVFGILAAVSGAIFAWLGGRADRRFGPRPVILTCILLLVAASVSVVLVSRDSVFGIGLPAGSALPDIVFYGLGAVIGAAGGALQSASRTMLVHQADPDRMTEAFGLYALAGKATSFLAPLMIGAVTALSGSQRIGVVPVIVLFLAGLALLRWVKPEGEQQK